MLNTDANTQRGLAQLSPAVKAMLTDELMTVLDQLIEAPDTVLLYRLQGRAKLLKDVLRMIEHAESHQR